MLAERKAEAVERYRKKDMLQTVDTLLRANDAILKTVRSNPQGAAEALVQCQESAIALGTYIDTLDEKYTSLVHVLEDYCENIYQMSENLSDENLCRKVSKKIQKQLTGLQNSIKYDLPEDRKEIVFLPYKASMWVSLESVWKAADADENTDAYVIPIPYFDKNPDGTFREEHYEGDQYPKYVPVTRYDEYDLKTRRPDVIYIHNPYDECNHVTSVHPYFYSKNLRNFTDKLVYIPYFILGEIGPDNQPAIDGMKHFCFMPGTIYADQVIVQSENMRQIYINEYIKAAKEMGLSGEHVDRKSLEKKFLGTGSPKIDKVLNTRKEDLEIPAEWLRVIEKPDGSWKKIVFYNTSVSALLHDEDKLLRKMESVFGIFKKNRDEVALLWRPHPLIQSTIESMRPQLWEAYQEIRDKYVEEGWGIYDDTADLDRAVVISDAYYGVGSSSVVQVYQKTGKLMLMQCIKDDNKCVENGIINLNVNAVVEYKGSFYFSGVGVDFNGLYRMNCLTGKTEYLAPFEKEEECHALHKSVYRYENEIWFIPWMGKYIVCVNLETLAMQYYPIPYTNVNKKGQIYQMAYSSSGRFDEYKLYLVPMKYDTVVVIDMKEKTVSPFYNVVDVEHEAMIYGTVDGRELWMIPYVGNRIIRLNLDDGNVKYCDWKYRTDDYYGMLYHEGKIWFAPHKADSVLYLEPKTMEYHTIPLGDLYNEKYLYWEVEYFDEKIWMLPKASSLILYWDCKEKKLHSVCKDKMMCTTHLTGLVRADSEDKFILESGETGCVSIYDGKNHDFKSISSYMSEDECIEILVNKYGSQNGVKKNFKGVHYEQNIGINNFLNILCW